MFGVFFFTSVECGIFRVHYDKQFYQVSASTAFFTYRVEWISLNSCLQNF